jgi:hypothetical protein
MNSASQNFPHHLGVLRQRMLHPTDYELAVNYFLEEFAGDMAFVRGLGTGTDAPSGGSAERRRLESHGASRGGRKRARIAFARTGVRAWQCPGGRAHCIVLLL